MVNKTQNTRFLCFYSSLLQQELQKGSKESLQNNRGAASRSSWGLVSLQSRSGTWLSLLCGCLFIATLGVACVDQLCSVFGHQLDQTWGRARGNKGEDPGELKRSEQKIHERLSVVKTNGCKWLDARC